MTTDEDRLRDMLEYLANSTTTSTTSTSNRHAPAHDPPAYQPPTRDIGFGL